MAQTFWRFALHTQAAPPLADLLSEQDLDIIFGFVFPMIAWDDTKRGWVVCNHEGHIHAGLFRSRGGAQEGLATCVVEAFRQAVDDLRR